MTTPENASEPSCPAEKGPAEEVSKSSFRRQVWLNLEKNKLVNFPRPAFGRIPNFKGSDEAAKKLLELDDFKNAKSVEVNPDKAQETARILVLEQKKELYVAVPRLKEGLLKHIVVPEDASKDDIKNAVSRGGIEFNGKTVNIADPVKIDLLVIGSVAVSHDGYRIGKGRGYVDLEFSVLLEMNAITDQTVIVTMVHDSQVFENLPKEIFKPFDVPVDYILTPTQIIKVENRLARPKGIIWSILSNRRVNSMPALQSLKESNEKNGIDVTLKEEDTDVESYEKKPHYKRFPRRRPRSEGRTSESQGEDAENARPRRFYRRRYFQRPAQRKTDKNEPENESGAENKPAKSQKSQRRPVRKNRQQIDFSLMVSNIEKTVRVRDLKNALTERGIKPNEITWRGYRGFCYLHYAKPKSAPRPREDCDTQENIPEIQPIVVDNVIEILQNLKICPESENGLSVKIMKPISRIETANVTAV